MADEEIAVKEARVSNLRDAARRVLRQENAVLIIVLGALIGGMGGVTKGLTIAPSNMMNVLLQSSIRGVAAVGQAFVILSAGIDVSVGGVALMCSVLGASMMTKAPWLSTVGYPMSPYLVIPVMLLVGTGWGVINGSLVARIGVPALIVTLGIWEVTKGVSFMICRGASVGEQPLNLAFFGSGHIAGVPTPVITFIVVGVIGYFVLHYTVFGRSVYAVGGNPASAWLSGINVKRIQFMVFVISGFLAALAGVIMTARIMSASMVMLSGLEIDSIAAVTIGGVSLAGGRGTLIGPVIGSLIIGVINNGMSVLGAGPSVQGIVKGVIIIGAVTADCIRRRR